MADFYLVQAVVEVAEYMNDSRMVDDSRLVRALSVEEARQKYENYWEGRTEPYSVSYYVVSCHVMETII